MPTFPRTDRVSISKATAIEQCEMILWHLREREIEDLDPTFLQVHALSLWQLIGDLCHPDTDWDTDGDEQQLSKLFPRPQPPV